MLDVEKRPPTVQATRDFELVPASEFTTQHLTDLYNQTRVDYVVPMPMNEQKFREYMFHYDLSLENSVVAIDGEERLGLAMLGVRGERTWITRLGVVPNGRRRGVGQGMMEALIENAKSLQAKQIQLEVIKNNAPAERLFRRFGFTPWRDLLVVRRPPRPVNIITTGIHTEQLDTRAAAELLNRRKVAASWVTDNESLLNAASISALQATLPNGASGWLVYQNTSFQLIRLILQTEQGAPADVANALLQHLHWRHGAQDTICENIPADDPHWPVMKQMGYVLSFTRTEMSRTL